jgi:hypothetical protein
MYHGFFEKTMFFQKKMKKTGHGTPFGGCLARWGQTPRGGGV